MTSFTTENSDFFDELNQSLFTVDSRVQSDKSPARVLNSGLVSINSLTVINPYLPDQFDLKGIFSTAEVISRVIMKSRLDSIEFGWLRDLVPLVAKCNLSEELFLVGAGIPNDGLINFQVIDGSNGAARLNQSAVAKAHNFQSELARELCLPLQRLNFYIEFGNLQFIDEQTAVMTTQILDENQGISKEQIADELSMIGVTRCIFVKPLEVCGHSDMLIGVIGNQLYIPQITDRTIFFDSNPEFVCMSSTELDLLAKQFSDMGYNVERLPVPVATQSNGRILMMSPVNFATKIESPSKISVCMPTPNAETIEYILDATNNLSIRDMEYLIEEYQSEVQSIFNSKHSDSIIIEWAKFDLKKQGGPHCLTANWPDECSSSPWLGMP